MLSLISYCRLALIPGVVIMTRILKNELLDATKTEIPFDIKALLNCTLI
jgi:hypothetical protein